MLFIVTLFNLRYKTWILASSETWRNHKTKAVCILTSLAKLNFDLLILNQFSNSFFFCIVLNDFWKKSHKGLKPYTPLHMASNFRPSSVVGLFKVLRPVRIFNENQRGQTKNSWNICSRVSEVKMIFPLRRLKIIGYQVRFLGSTI